MNYISVRSFDNYLYANILLNRLKDEGFDCYLKDENTVTIDPLLSPAIGGMKLMVQEPDVPRANALLEQIENDYVSTIPCPDCGQKTLQRLSRADVPKNFFTALIYQLFMGTTRNEERFYRCSNCGLKLNDLPGFNDE